MKQLYVKLISDGTWFDKGTEVFCTDQPLESMTRFTKEKYEQRVNDSWGILCRGYVDGGTRIDEEMCSYDEFEVEFVESKEQ